MTDLQAEIATIRNDMRDVMQARLPGVAVRARVSELLPDQVEYTAGFGIEVAMHLSIESVRVAPPGAAAVPMADKAMHQLERSLFEMTALGLAERDQRMQQAIARRLITSGAPDMLNWTPIPFRQAFLDLQAGRLDVTL